MGSACNYCRVSPGLNKLVRFDCGHHVCHSCVKQHADVFQSGQISLRCKDCKQPAKGSPQGIIPEPVKIRVKYGAQFYTFTIDADLTTRALAIKMAFIKKMNQEVMKNAKLNQQELMLRIIGQGYVFEQNFVFQLRQNWGNLEIGYIPERNYQCR